MATFRDRFNILFDESDLSQEEFGKLFNATKSQVFNWRNGRGEPDIETVKLIAKALSVLAYCQ
jgi:transcriptional regulator with XRE-family HTH domain